MTVVTVHNDSSDLRFNKGFFTRHQVIRPLRAEEDAAGSARTAGSLCGHRRKATAECFLDRSFRGFPCHRIQELRWPWSVECSEADTLLEGAESTAGKKE